MMKLQATVLHLSGVALALFGVADARVLGFDNSGEFVFTPVSGSSKTSACLVSCINHVARINEGLCDYTSKVGCLCSSPHPNVVRNQVISCLKGCPSMEPKDIYLGIIAYNDVCKLVQDEHNSQPADLAIEAFNLDAVERHVRAALEGKFPQLKQKRQDGSSNPVVTTDVTAEVAAGTAAPDVTTDVSTDVVTGSATGSVAPDVTTDIATDVATDVATDSATDVATDIATDSVAPDVTTDVTTDSFATDSVAPDVTTDVTTDSFATESIAPEVTTDTTTDSFATESIAPEVTTEVTSSPETPFPVISTSSPNITGVSSRAGSNITIVQPGITQPTVAGSTGSASLMAPISISMLLMATSLVFFMSV